MENKISASLAERFGEIRDPRVAGRCEHLLIEVIIIALDTLGCQKAIAQTIRDEKADYVLQVKENQGQTAKPNAKRLFTSPCLTFVQESGAGNPTPPGPLSP